MNNDDQPIASLSTDTFDVFVDTGWRCSICFSLAQVLCAGETMCVEHAKEWDHGYGKSIAELKKELKK